MSAMRAGAGARSAPGPGAGTAARPWEAVTVRWGIAGADGVAERWLEWRLSRGEGDEARCEAVVVMKDGAEEVVERARGAGVESDWGRGLEHVDVPGLVEVTLRVGSGGAVELVYARTGVLARLGVRGGRAEQPEIVIGERGSGGPSSAAG